MAAASKEHPRASAISSAGALNLVTLLSPRATAACAIAASITQACDAPSPLPSQTTARPATSYSAAPDAALSTPRSPKPEPSTLPLNVVLVMIDGWRHDVPWTGYPKQTMPFLTEFRKRCVTYTHAYALSSNTARSVAALFAGKFPSAMSRTGYYFTNWQPENQMLAETLASEGHQTVAAFAHAYFFPASGLRQGFSQSRVLPGTFLKNTRDDNKTSRRLGALTRKLLRRARKQPNAERRVFGYVHFMDPHYPYLARAGAPDFGRGDRGRYDQELWATDRAIATLVRSQPLGPNTAWIFTGDHGEAFGEHGHQKHGYELWEVLVRVPLLVCAPGLRARTIRKRRSHIDLAPTILELMASSAHSGLRGRSLMPELRGGGASRRTVVVDLPRDQLQDRRRAIIRGRHKLIAIGDDESFRLYDLKADPSERINLEHRRPRLMARMLKRYRRVGRTIANRPVKGSQPALRGAPAGRRW